MPHQVQGLLYLELVRLYLNLGADALFYQKDEDVNDLDVDFLHAVGIALVWYAHFHVTERG